MLFKRVYSTKIVLKTKRIKQNQSKTCSFCKLTDDQSSHSLFNSGSKDGRRKINNVISSEDPYNCIHR